MRPPPRAVIDRIVHHATVLTTNGGHPDDLSPPPGPRDSPPRPGAFRRSYYGRPVKPVDRRAPLTWASVPDDYHEQISCATLRTRVESGAIGHPGGRGTESRRLPMGGTKTHAVARVLATTLRAPPASAGATVSGL